MNSLVIYGSRYGNTQRIAYAIAAGLRAWGKVEGLEAEKADGIRLHGYDLVVLGGPTEGHGITGQGRGGNGGDPMRALKLFAQERSPR
jgi:flavodoxin